MNAVLPDPPFLESESTWRRWTWLAGTALIACVALGFRLGSRPIAVWDESRLANNALEMSQSGLSLVTTFGGVPDHWNTKPPLLIWLMSLSIKFLGANEWAVRLPSALATVATALLMFVFCTRRLGKPFVGFVSAMLLLLTPGYMYFHGARSGDYDATLALFTTGYLMAAYLYLHGREADRTRWLAVCSVAIVLAVMTKSIQGMIFFPALALYAGLHGRVAQMARSPATYVCVGAVVSIVMGYYLVREHIDPGYFAAANTYDFLGRFTTGLDRNERSVWSYVMEPDLVLRLLPALTAAAWLGWRGQGEHRRLAQYLGLLTVFYLLVISLAKTKLTWYFIPLYPWLAMLVAMGLDALLVGASRQQKWALSVGARVRAWSCASLATVVLVGGAFTVDELIRADLDHTPSRYSLFLRSPAMHDSGFKKIVVVHPGYPNGEDRYVTAPALFYVNTLRREGRSVVIQAPDQPIPAEADAVLICGTVGEKVERFSAMRAAVLAGGCGLYQPPGPVLDGELPHAPPPGR